MLKLVSFLYWDLKFVLGSDIVLLGTEKRDSKVRDSKIKSRNNKDLGRPVFMTNIVILILIGLI
jgi:hypothetical protein